MTPIALAVSASMWLLQAGTAAPALPQTQPADIINATPLVAPATRPAANPIARAFEQANRRTVKIYGAAIAGEHGYGTGVIVSPDGFVITILSLLLETTNLRAVTSDGHVYTAEVTYRDDYRQLALLKMARHPENVDTSASIRDQMAISNLEPMPMADSTHLQGGDWVLAVGNAFKVAEADEPMSVMKGVLCGRAPLDAVRGTQPFPYRGEVLLIDAITSNPGAPGSALLDIDGRWVGLTGKIVTSRLTNTFLNYAYTIEEVRAFLRDAQSGAAAASRPVSADAPLGYHGIRLSKIAYHKEMPFVQRVIKGSPAEAAGVKADDLIVSANGTAIPRSRTFYELCERLHAGDELSLIIKRGDQLLPLRMKLTEEPK